MADKNEIIRKIQRYYLFFGTNEYKLRERVSSLIGAVIPSGGEVFDLDRFEGRRCEIPTLINSVSTPPVVGPLRVVVLYNVERIAAKGQKMLNDFLPKVPEYSVLAMTASKTDKRSSLFKDLLKLKKKQSFEFNELPPVEAAKLIIEFAEARGKSIDPHIADMLVTIFGTDPYRLENEVEKLSLFTGENERIDKKDLAFSAGFSRIETPYDLPELLLAGHLDSALGLVSMALISGSSEMQILYILKNYFIRLNAASNLNSIKELMSKLRIPFPAAKSIFPNSKRVSKSGILEGLREIFKAEYALKSARFPSDVIIELLLIRLFLWVSGNNSR